MIGEDEIGKLERILGYLESNVENGKVIQVPILFVDVRYLRRSILRQGIVIPEDLDRRTNEGNLERIRSQTYSNFFLERLEELGVDLLERKPTDVYKRFKGMEGLLPNIIGDDRIDYTNRFNAFKNNYFFSKGMQALTGNNDPDFNAARRYAKRIEDEVLAEKLYSSIDEHLELGASSSDSLFRNQTYNDIIRNLKYKTSNNGLYIQAIQTYRDAIKNRLDQEPSPDVESAKFLDFLQEFIAQSLHEYMDSLVQSKAAQNGIAWSGIKHMFMNVLYPAADLGIIDRDKVSTIHSTYFPKMSTNK